MKKEKDYSKLLELRKKEEEKLDKLVCDKIAYKHKFIEKLHLHFICGLTFTLMSSIALAIIFGQDSSLVLISLLGMLYIIIMFSTYGVLEIKYKKEYKKEQKKR